MNPNLIRQNEFEVLALPHADSLLRVALRLTGERSRAQDAVQDTFLLAWRSFHQFDIHTNCKAWLFRIMLNVLYKRGRELRTRPREVPLHESLASPDGGDGKALHRLQVLSALDNLSQDYRTVLLLAVVEGFTCKEIAAMLGIPIGTVMSRLSRARAALRNVLMPREAGSAAHRPRPDCASREIQ